MARIRWTDEEREIVCEQAWEIFKLEPFIPFKDLIKQSQLCLPKDRRRQIMGLNGIPELEEYFKRKLAEPEPEPEPELSIEEVIQRKLKQTIQGEIQKYTEQLATAIQSNPGNKGKEKEKNEEDLFRVVIVGLKNGQYKSLHTPSGVKLVCVSKDVPVTTKKADICIVMTKFVSHETFNRVKKQYGKDLVCCTGGVSSVQKLLRDLEDLK